MSRVEHIGDATLYWELPRWQRHRLRKKGVVIPPKPRPTGYTQSPEHVEKRKRTGPDHYNWSGDTVSKKVGRQRALRLFPDLGPCETCGADKTERHHKDENPANNEPANIAVLCRSCHAAAHVALNRSKRAAA